MKQKSRKGGRRDKLPKRGKSPAHRKASPRNEVIVTGILQKNKKGFGFVLAEGDEGDVFISSSKMDGAMNGDLVSARLYPDSRRGERKEGYIYKIIERRTKEVVGTFEKSKSFGIVTPDDMRMRDEIFVMKKNFNDAQRGDKVVVEIINYPDSENSAEGKVIEIIGKAGEQGTDIKSIIRAYGLTQEFPARVIAETQQIGQEVSEADVAGRDDLREKLIFTIDGADSKDFDDAVSIEAASNGNVILGVHIADVAHYVKEGTPLDQEAFKRGTSVYLLDQVIPMLPEPISNGICSLNEGVDRLTLSVDMEINDHGEVVSHRIYESVIRSKARLVYTDVSDFLENGDGALIESHPEVLDALRDMAEVAATLRKIREERGSIDFDLDEARIMLNDEGIPVDIEVAERRTANKLIEEFMLLANETVAEHYFWSKLPFVYRVHERPNPDKVMAFKTFLGGFGLDLKGSPENMVPKAFRDLLKKVSGRPEEKVISTVMLRSMQKAVYGTECQGHFGLALKYYSHFTSPIRRYPDLTIHRIIKESLNNPEIPEKRIKALGEITEAAAKQSSATEQRALELEREVEKLKKAEYMTYYIGEVYEAVISGVTSFGIFTELDNTIEGLIRMEYLDDDYYDYEPDKYRLIGRRTKKIYRLGDKVVIKVADVDLDSREVDFILVNGDERF